MKRAFSKPAISYEQQVTLLQSRGMRIDDSAKASFYLKHLNYYRLGAYWLPFEADHAAHRFRPGTHFDQVLDLYIFDLELRLLMLDAIERLEVSVRTQWAYHVAHRHGPHAHLDQTIWHPRFWQVNIEKLREEVDRSDETFVRHLKNTYSEALPPIWAACEVMSLGNLSRWYAALQPMATRSAIASTFDLDERTLQSLLHHLAQVRNVCAHHCRLWNREFVVTLPRLKGKPARLVKEFQPGSRKLYNTLILLLHCLDVISPEHTWRQRVMGLINNHGVSVNDMGFPADWPSRPIWEARL